MRSKGGQWEDAPKQSQRVSFEMNAKDDLASMLQGRIKEAEF